MENKGYFIDEAENPGGNDWDMKIYFHFVLIFFGLSIIRQSFYSLFSILLSGETDESKFIDFDLLCVITWLFVC